MNNDNDDYNDDTLEITGVDKMNNMNNTETDTNYNTVEITGVS